MREMSYSSSCIFGWLVCWEVLFVVFFFTCQFFCIALEALILGDISLFSYTLWNSYMTNATIFWMLQFFLRVKRSLQYGVFPGACPTVKGKNCFVYSETKGNFLLLNVKFTLVKITYTKICSMY